METDIFPAVSANKLDWICVSQTWIHRYIPKAPKGNFLWESYRCHLILVTILFKKNIFSHMDN